MPETSLINGNTNGHNNMYELEDGSNFLFTSESVGEGHPGSYIFGAFWVREHGAAAAQRSDGPRNGQKRSAPPLHNIATWGGGHVLAEPPPAADSTENGASWRLVRWRRFAKVRLGDLPKTGVGRDSSTRDITKTGKRGSGRFSYTLELVRDTFSHNPGTCGRSLFKGGGN